MYLKSLEIQGFKSFADRTVLTFGRGITAIVGPNGSGKSNISDAVRWVLGEQSTKTLRGAKMEDVIFGGTQFRGPVGFAEVSLILDNSGGELPVEASEVMVTRRYFRSGESEYYINRTSVRLRDIHEIFMDTGLGRDGYSIIGQGRIDEILAAKSGDRREIFEEAAGISKFRYRKEEAERKLENTAANLLRINDKIAELELNVEPLREQSEKAKRFLVLRDELRVEEVSLWMKKLDELRKNSEKVERDYSAVSKQLEGENTELEKLYRDIDKLAMAIQERDVALEQLRSLLSDTEGEKNTAESEATVIDGTIKNLKDNILRIKSDIDEQEGRESGIAEQLADRRRRIEEAEKGISETEARLQELSEELARIEEQSRGLIERAEELESEISVADGDLARLDLECSLLDASNAELIERRTALSSDSWLREGETEELAAILKLKQDEKTKAEKQAESLKNVISGYEIRLNNRQKKLDKVNSDRNGLTVEKNSLEHRIRLLEDMERDYEGFSRAVKLVMQEKARGTLKGIHGPVSQLVKMAPEYTLAIETALGGSLQNIVTDSEEDGKQAIDLLKRRDGGRATFLPLTAIRGRLMDENVQGEPGFAGIASEIVETAPKYREIIRNALGRTVIAENMDRAISIARKFRYRFKIVTLDGQVINAGGSMTGGSTSRNTGILSRAAELERLRRSLKELDEKLSAGESAATELRREVAAAEYELDVARAEQRQADDAVLRLSGEAALAEERYETSRAAVENLAEELERLGDRLSENKRRGEKLASEREQIEGSRTGLVYKLDELRKELKDRSEAASEVESGAASLREKRSGQQSERQTLIDNLYELEHISKQFWEDRSKRQELAEEYRVQIAENEQAAAEKWKAADEAAKRCDSIREDISRITAERLETEGLKSTADREGQEKNKTIVVLERERSRLEQKKTELDMSEKQIVDRLWDSYELTRSTASEIVRQIDNEGQVQKRISDIKREISRLGDINIGSIDEYARVSERYGYLSDQRDDVQKSKTELGEIIADITRKMREIFAAEFDRINESFSDTFTEIFGGGRAKLELEDRDDILNCGIDIKVQPPGKSLKTITLLSGGEKAFVAIALYFAILKVRPTPFCVLDEIEAALDEVNVARFAAYLRKLCDSTQFIVITHRRGTMEGSDMLYGVTMQVQGESKILALNIAEAERELGMKLK